MFRSRNTWIVLILLTACTAKNDVLEGKWKLSSLFYNASYQIIDKGDEFEAVVLSYNDGTSNYQYRDDERYYAFTDLKRKDDIYVDGTSGATKQKGKAKVSVKVLHKDSLELTTSIANQELKEIWIRVK